MRISIKRTIKYSSFLLGAAVMCIFVACTEKAEQSDAELPGGINGCVRSNAGGQGFRVSIVDPTGAQSPQVAVTGSDGTFCFSEVKAGKYTVDVQREGFEWGWMYIDGVRVSNGRSFVVKNNQTTEIDVYMQVSSYMNEELTITDINGNPIGNQIVIPKYTSTIAIKLYNGTAQDASWNLHKLCYISGERDTIIGTIPTYTRHTFDIFTSISPTSGTLSPGDVTIITGIINPDIYTLDRYTQSLRELDLYSTVGYHSACKTIELYFPFM